MLPQFLQITESTLSIISIAPIRREFCFISFSCACTCCVSLSSLTLLCHRCVLPKLCAGAGCPATWEGQAEGFVLLCAMSPPGNPALEMCFQFFPLKYVVSSIAIEYYIPLLLVP